MAITKIKIYRTRLVHEECSIDFEHPDYLDNRQWEHQDAIERLASIETFDKRESLSWVQTAAHNQGFSIRIAPDDVVTPAPVGIPMSTFELPAPASDDGLTVPPIPAGVFYSKKDDNFFDAMTNYGMGADFYSTWKLRADEFPHPPRTVPVLGKADDIDRSYNWEV
jgi:hypothetical protein